MPTFTQTNFTSGLHSQYHQPGDESDIINYKSIEKIIELYESIILKFNDEKPNFIAFTDKEVNNIRLSAIIPQSYFSHEFTNKNE